MILHTWHVGKGLLPSCLLCIFKMRVFLLIKVALSKCNYSDPIFYILQIEELFTVYCKSMTPVFIHLIGSKYRENLSSNIVHWATFTSSHTLLQRKSQKHINTPWGFTAATFNSALSLSLWVLIAKLFAIKLSEVLPQAWQHSPQL